MVAAIIAFSIANWPAGHPDGDEKNDRQLETNLEPSEETSNPAKCVVKKLLRISQNVCTVVVNSQATQRPASYVPS
jgi:hypothetical protein